ncbi:protein FAR1-RELATED SEQUENCE 5-like [Helianthus annuus]|uniref:protein FAR1-RELATED SEQUENCE 5-like n=1 Tax=Helianthus annuus TaxID=4232 RepID=UPI000B909926|nr:protein FAR1-RELATED SEQUENCE 5-like [Helianthus annuus]
MEDLPTYSPTNVIPNCFILDESSTHGGSSSSGVRDVGGKNIRSEVAAHFQIYSPTEEDMWSSDESGEEPLGPACPNDRGKSPLIIPDAHKVTVGVLILSDDQQGTPRYYVTQTPEGTKFWTPFVDKEFLPVLGKSYETFEEVVAMYKVYGYEAGFNVKKAQTKVRNGCPTHKYLRCSKAAKPQKKRTFDTLFESLAMCSRNSTFTLTDCKARLLIVATQDPIRFVVHSWSDVHNHPLIDTFNRDLSKFSRKLPFAAQQFIHQMSLNRIGPVKTHRFLVSIKGGNHNVRGTTDDFKNYSQQLRIFIGDRDAQLLLERLRDRSENLANFYYDFVVSEGKLKAVFWADEISNLNYKAFGDVLAFDATYQTNKYNMIFVPFTGVDNHMHCVTFGARLLLNETVESYKWLLQAFMKAYHTEPRLILSDQDPSMKQVIQQVFTTARHRLCMWHIMKKLPTKDHQWLNEMYEIRERWVLAFFRDIPMCCLMKTTSRSESSNASFKVNSTSANTLVQFMLCYEARIDSQRYRQRVSEFKSSSIVYQGKSNLPIEQHAFSVYSHSVFHVVRKEILKGKFCCFITNQTLEAGMTVFSVQHEDNLFTVKFNSMDNTAECSCRGFTRIGYLCRHVFCVYRLQHVDAIPSKYIANRWRRDVSPKRVFSIDSRYGVDTQPQAVMHNEIIDVITDCVDVVRNNTESLSTLLETAKSDQTEYVNQGIYFDARPSVNKGCL